MHMQKVIEQCTLYYLMWLKKIMNLYVAKYAWMLAGKNH